MPEQIKFNRKNIKPFKGKMIMLKYSHRVPGNKKEYDKTISGIINGSGDQHFFFKPNNEDLEISLKYEQIKNINVLNRYHQTT